MAKKKAATSKPKAARAAGKARTKSEIVVAIATDTELAKKDVATIIESLTTLLKKDLAKTGAFALSGVFKATVVKKPATKARKGINPFTKEEVMFKAKPARNVVKIRALKALKESV